MGFLNPFFLAAAVAVAIPVFLHLFRRHEDRRLAFPALRYLLRTEREHARRIRLRQLVLLLLRAAAVLLIVAAGARMVLAGRGATHDPTALAIVLDNSMSSGRIQGRDRVLDRLKAMATRTLDAAGPEDRIWILRAGEPWDVSVPGGAREARIRVLDTDVSAAAADLGASLERARELVLAAGLSRAEVHLLSDLQASGFAGADVAVAADLPVVVWAPPTPSEPNHRIEGILVGEGLPPLANRRTDVAVTVSGPEGGDPLPVRLVVGDRIRGAGSARPGASVVLPVGPFQVGGVEGWAETDPDALGADDRRYFSFQVRPPVPVASPVAESFFLEQGLAALADAGRIHRTPASQAGVVFAVGGAGLSTAPAAQVVLPPEETTLLPALNRRLSNAGIPWRYASSGEATEVQVAENRLPVTLEAVRVLDHYVLSPAPGSIPDADVPVRLSDGAPMVVRGRTPTGPYLLLATPLDPAWTTLPVSAGMLPLLEWIVARWPGGGLEATDVIAGSPLPLPPGATHVEAPSGARFAADGSRLHRATGEAGLWSVLRGDTVLERVAVNPPARESGPESVTRERLQAVLGGEPALVADADDWERVIFRSRQGPEAWWPLLAAAFVVLLLESWTASLGSATRGVRRHAPAPVSSPPRSEEPGVPLP